MADFGYDITDYRAIHPIFGTLEDFDALLAEAHRRGIKVILDLVPNHTSDRHPWFTESRSSRDSFRRDWYIWRDPAADGGPPNNWLSTFGGSAWEWDARTGQYYYHAYLKEQPDLNWRNKDVQSAMHDVMRFWLDRGVDGFRIDVLWHLIKDDQFRPNPPNPHYGDGLWPYRRLLATYTTDRPEVHDIIAGMRAVMDDYGDRLMIGEIYLPVERLVTYYGSAGGGCHLPFNFQLIEIPWQAAAIGAAIDAYEAALPAQGWPNWVLSNHDKPRIAVRVGREQARVAAMLLLTLRGTPTLYYGDELGMEPPPVPPESVQDPWEINVPGFGLGRDRSRTPMQWDASPQAGFTIGVPWLPLSPDYRTVNVAAEQQDPTSILTLYRRLIVLRRREPALHAGTYRRLPVSEDLLVYVREAVNRAFLVALNFSTQPQTVRRSGPQSIGTVLLSTALDRENEQITEEIALRPHEGIVAQLSPQR